MILWMTTAFQWASHRMLVPDSCLCSMQRTHYRLVHKCSHSELDEDKKQTNISKYSSTPVLSTLSLSAFQRKA